MPTKRELKGNITIGNTRYPATITWEAGSIGEGAYGKVYKARIQFDKVIPHKRNPKTGWVIKEIPKNKFNPDEINLLKQQKYLTFDLLEDKENYYIVTEHVPEKNLEYVDLNTLSLLDRINIARQLTMWLNNLHHNNTGPIMHGDIHGGNVRLFGKDNELTVYLIDFGLAINLKENPLSNLTDPKDPRYAEYRNKKYTNIEKLTKLDIEMSAFAIFSQLLPIDLEISQKYSNINSYVNLFISAMSSSFTNTNLGPSTENVVHFFNTLYQIAETESRIQKLEKEEDSNKTTEINTLSEKLDVYTAKLLLIYADIYEKKSPHVKPEFTQFELETNSKSRNEIIKNFFIDTNVCYTAQDIQNEFREKLSPLEKIRGFLDENNNLDKLTKIEFNNMVNSIKKLKTSEFSIVDLENLSLNKGSLEKKRTLAFAMIENMLKEKSIDQINPFQKSLVTAGKTGKIDYLYKRQGLITFSIYNHKWAGQKVSATWLKVMDIFTKRKETLKNKLSKDKEKNLLIPKSNVF